MSAIARLFGKSPFSPLQTHMVRVAGCMQKLTDILAILPEKNMGKIEKLSSELSKLEHEADLTKNDIRNHLPKSLFLPIDRSHFLDVLSIQDSIADKAEDIGLLLCLRPLEPFSPLDQTIQDYFKKSVSVFHASRDIIQEINELLESSFGGIEAEKVKTMVETTAKLESLCDIMQHQLMRALFQKGETLSHPGFYLWMKLIEEIAAIAHISERLANRIRMVLELK